MTDAEIVVARLDQLEDQRARHEDWIARLDRDPGKDLPVDAAHEARSERLAELRHHSEEVVKLSSAIDIREQQLASDNGLAARLRRAALRKASADGTDEEFLAELHQAMREGERERDAKAALRELADKRNRPARPEARSVAAAVMSSPDVFDLLRRRMRPAVEVNEWGAQVEVMSAEPVLDSTDVAVLAIILNLLTETDPVVLPTTSGGGGWPRGSDVPPLDRLLARVLHLARNEFLAVTPSDDGTSRSVTHGAKSLAIAHDAGVDAYR